MGRYLDAYAVGDVFTSAPFTITAEHVIRFAREYDPQPFHTDPEAARDTIFGELVSSGWMTAALTIKLIVESSGFVPEGGLVGGGIEELRWPRPTYPGDVITVRVEVLDIRISRTKPERGVLRARIDTTRQDGALVQTWVGNLIIPRDPALVGAPSASA